MNKKNPLLMVPPDIPPNKGEAPRRALFAAGFADPRGKRYLHSIWEDTPENKKKIETIKARLHVTGTDCHDRLLKDDEYRNEPGFVGSGKGGK